jgi:SAM-dependent methyltransferase
VCNGSLRGAGRGTFHVGDRSFPTAFSYCRDCDIFCRRIPLELRAQRFESAGYTSDENRTKLLVRRERFFNHLLDMIEGQLGRPTDSLLDVGAAYGHLLRIAGSRGIASAGVETVARLRSDISISLGVPCWAELRDVQGSFDAVTFIDSFYYFDEPGPALDIVASLLKPDGVLVLRVANRNVAVRAAGLLGFERRFDLVADHLVGWSQRGLRKVLSAHGFRVERIRFDEPGWRRPLRQRLIYFLAVAVSLVTQRWDAPISPGLTVVATKKHPAQVGHPGPPIHDPPGRGTGARR